MTGVTNIDTIVVKSRWATTIGALCDKFGSDVQTGPFGSQLHASDYSDDGIPVVMPHDMQGGRIVCDHIARVAAKNVTRLRRHVLRAGDVVYSRRGDVTRFAVVTDREEGWLCGTGSIRIRINSPEISIGYLRWYLQQQAVGNWLKHHAKGVTMPNLNTEVVRALPFVYPPRADQLRIAEVLDRADALRTKRRAVLTELDTLTQAIFVDMFGDPVGNPKGWPIRELKEVVKKGTIVTYGIVQAGEEFASGVPYIRTGDIVDGAIAIDGLRHTDPQIAAKFDRSRVRSGDIVMSIRATVGTTALVPDELDGANLTQGTGRIAPGESTDRHYLLCYLRSAGTQHWISRQIKGATFREITLARLRELPVALPPIELQRDFSNRIGVVERLRALYRASCVELEALSAALQHRAFRGEL